MCDPVTTSLITVGALGYMDYNRKKADKATSDAKADAEKDQRKMEKQREKGLKKAQLEETNAAKKAQTERMKQEDVFKRYGYRGTFGTAGGGLGLTGPATSQRKTLLGGV